MSVVPVSSPDTTELVQLKKQLSLRGRLILPSDADFTEETSNFNWDCNEKPTMVIRCANTSDVIAAVNYVRNNKLDFTVACGRHTRFALHPNTVMISLNGMRTVTIDPETQIATAQGGARNGDLDEECQIYGLATPAGTNQDTGLGGLATGGGVGYISRRFGMTCDNVISAQVVLADGRLVTASEKENPQLFWAIRGGGGNFGIVTQFKIRLHKIGFQPPANAPAEIEAKRNQVIHGVMIYPPFAAQGLFEFMDKYQDSALSRDFSCSAGLIHGPHGPAVLCAPVYYGPSLEEGWKLIQPLREHNKPVMDMLHEGSYLELQRSMEDHQQPGHYYERAVLLKGLDTETMNKLVEAYTRLPKGAEKTAILILSFGGAIGDKSNDACAFAHREARWWCAVIANFEPHARDATIAWSREVKEILQKSPNALGSYMNAITKQSAELVFGANLPTLRTIKQQYDPNNFFHHNVNVVPSA